MADSRVEARTVPGERRRVLVVSYHFGDTSATGGFRWRAIAGGLEARGWQVDILCAGDSSSEKRFGGHVMYVPPARGIPLVRRLLDRHASAPAGRIATEPTTSGASDAGMGPSLAPEPSFSRRLRAMIGRTLRKLDTLAADYAWMRSASKVAVAAARERPYLCVVVSAPPMLSLLVGRVVAAKTGLPFVADYRDPWFFGAGPLQARKHPFARIIDSSLDRMAQRSATVVVHNTDRARRAVSSELPSIPGRRAVIMNGYDGHLADVRPDGSCFRVVYGGWIHPYMDPRPLLRGLGRLRERVSPNDRSFRVEFLGSPRHIGGVPLLELAKSAGLDGCVALMDRMPRPAALARQQRASVLAALDYPHGNAVVMKFYDYAQMYGTMLLLGQPQGALAEAAQMINVPVIDPADDEAIDARLSLAWRKWEHRDWGSVNDAGQRFSRRRSIDDMQDLLLSLDG